MLGRWEIGTTQESPHECKMCSVQLSFYCRALLISLHVTLQTAKLAIVNCSQHVKMLSYVDKENIHRVNTKIRCHSRLISARQRHKILNSQLNLDILGLLKD